jgi:hypothetical protein
VDLFPEKEQLQFKSRKYIKERERTTAFIFFQKCIRNNKYIRTYLACTVSYSFHSNQVTITSITSKN